MMRRLLVAVAALGILATAYCAPSQESVGREARTPAIAMGQITVPTKTLVEAASIGTATGAKEYLLGGHVTGAVVAGQLIYVLDADAHRVRAYDADGVHQFDFAGEGQGPGEFLIADGMWTGNDVIFVNDPVQSRASRFSLDGSPKGEVILRRPLPVARWQRAVSERGTLLEGTLQITDAGAAIEVIEYGNDDSRQVLHTAPGPTEPQDPSPTGGSAPYRPQLVWAITRAGAVAVGNTDEQEFSVHPAVGDPITVSLDGSPFPVERQEIDGRKEAAAATPMPDGRPRQVELPDTKPMYRLILPDSSGRLWVLRDGPSEYLSDCGHDRFLPDLGPGPRPCWRSAMFADVFEETTGAWLFRVDDFLSEELGMELVFRPPLLFVSEDTLLARVSDDEGTVMVKRFHIEDAS